ncbi:MAG: hypothetical protein LIP11_01550 [Clostridiales bacterium]|nr:hypothetical protein [Clostridiales bacterium]
MAMYRAGKTIKRENPVVREQEPTDHSQVFQCRTPDFAWVKYEGEGYNIQLKIGKWETAGCKEIWHADLKQGLKVDYAYPHTGYDLFYVQKGKLEVTIHNTHSHAEAQTFLAEDDTIIDIPPYHTYSIRVLEDTAMYNYGGEYDLAACLEDLQAVKKENPETISSEADYLAFFRKYGVYATHLEYKKD